MKRYLIILSCFVSLTSMAQTDTRDDTKDQLKEYAKKDYIIHDWSWDIQNSVLLLEVNVTNPYDKDIAAMWFTFSAFDSKGKIVKDGKAIVIESIRVNPANGGYIDHKFEKAFKAKNVDELRIIKVKIRFADKTEKEIDGLRAVGGFK